MNVIFDMDGLMFDTEKVFIKAWDYAGERIGIGMLVHLYLQEMKHAFLYLVSSM